MPVGILWGETANGTADIWLFICEGLDYPHLTWEAPGFDYGGGNGSIGDPYLISDPSHLQTLSITPCHWDKHFKLVADLDLTGLSVTPIGSVANPFTGTFDGAGHVISNLAMSFFGDESCGTFRGDG